MRRFIISLLGAFVALVAVASAGVIGGMVTDKAQYLPGETVTFTLDNWSSATGCSATDIPFIAIYDDENVMIAQVTNATISGGTVTATYIAPATLGVYTARTQDQTTTCAERSVSFSVVAAQPTTTTTTLPPTTTTIAPTTTVATTTTTVVATTTTTVAGGALPNTGAPSALWLVAVVGAIGIGGALVATTRRSS